MKPGVILVMSAGWLIDTVARDRGLGNPGRLGGVALDVYEEGRRGVFPKIFPERCAGMNTSGADATFPNVLIHSRTGLSQPLEGFTTLLSVTAAICTALVDPFVGGSHSL